MKLKKRMLALVLGTILVGGSSYSYGSTERDISVYNNDILIIFDDVNPYIDENGRTMVPVRALAENLGYTVIWNENTKTSTIYDKKTKAWVEIRLDSDKYESPKGIKTMDTKVQVKNDRIFVPVRFITEGLGSDVRWEEVNQYGLIFIFSKDILSNVREKIVVDTLKRPYYNSSKVIDNQNIDEFTFAEEIELSNLKKSKNKKEEYHRDIQERVNYLRSNIKENDSILKVLKSAKSDKKLNLSVNVYGGDKYTEDEKYGYYIEATYKYNNDLYKFKYKLF